MDHPNNKVVPPDFLAYDASTNRGQSVRQAFEAAEKLAARCRQALGDSVVGIYLHGSLAMGGFNPSSSDVDLLVVVRWRPARERLQELTRLTLELHGSLRAGLDLEYTVVEEAALRAVVCPTPAVYHYSASHRAEYETNPGYLCADYEDPDLACQIGAAYERGIALYGPPLREWVPPVPKEAYLRSVLHDVSEAAAEIGSNPVYATLNLCRVLLLLREGRIASKKEGGEWGVSALPEWTAVVQAALDVYTGASDGPMPVPQSRLVDFAQDLLRRIKEAGGTEDAFAGETAELLCQPAEYAHKTALRQLLELYKYDFTAYDPEDVNECGMYEYRDLDAYWNQPGHYPFLLRANGKLAGFALIRRFSAPRHASIAPGPDAVRSSPPGEAAGANSAKPLLTEGPPSFRSAVYAGELYGHEMVEFFVLKKYRGAGLGRLAADRLFRRFPGPWKLGIMEENAPAAAFWHRAISACEAASACVETREPDWEGPVLRFSIS